MGDSLAQSKRRFGVILMTEFSARLRCFVAGLASFAVAAPLVVSNVAGSAYAADLGSYSAAGSHLPLSVDPIRHFYVRGDIGVARNTIGDLSQADLAANGGTFLSQSIGDSPVIGAGVGWQVSKHLRFDFTGEYRAKADVRGLDNLNIDIAAPDGTVQANTRYEGNISSIVGLVNGYVDLHNWRGFTPYIGAGVGIAHHRVSDLTTISSSTFTDLITGVDTTQVTNGLARPNSQTNFAWALMAGTSYDLSSNAKLDLGYRYTNLGSGVSMATGLIDCVCGTVGQPVKLSDLDSHEFRIGVRWALGGDARVPGHESLK